MKKDINDFNFLKTFFRSLNPKKYRILVLNNMLHTLFFFALMVLFSCIFTLIFNAGYFQDMGFSVDYSSNEQTDVLENSFLLNMILDQMSGGYVMMMLFLLPSVVLYLFSYLFFKYFLIAFIVALMSSLVIIFFKSRVSFVKVFKIALHSIMIMIIFDLVSVPFYSAFQVPFILYALLFGFSMYFVNSVNA